MKYRYAFFTCYSLLQYHPFRLYHYLSYFQKNLIRTQHRHFKQTVIQFNLFSILQEAFHRDHALEYAVHQLLWPKLLFLYQHHHHRQQHQREEQQQETMYDIIVIVSVLSHREFVLLRHCYQIQLHPYLLLLHYLHIASKIH